MNFELVTENNMDYLRQKSTPLTLKIHLVMLMIWQMVFMIMFSQLKPLVCQVFNFHFLIVSLVFMLNQISLL